MQIFKTFKLNFDVDMLTFFGWPGNCWATLFKHWAIFVYLQVTLTLAGED